MATDRSVTLRAQWLGQILRDMRERKGLVLREVAEYLQRTISTVSRCEQGIYPIRRVDAAAMLDLYGVQDEKQREVVLQLAGDVWRAGWWEQYSRDDVWGSTIDLVWLENRSQEIKAFATMTVPGLLQAADYARALMAVADWDASRSEIDRSIELRMHRQQILERDEPINLTVIMDESVLRREVGGSEVMGAQLRRLCEASEQPHIDIRVLPFTAGAHASPNGPFTLLKMADPFPEVVYVESSAGAIYLETDAVDRFVEIYDRLEGISLSPEESAAWLVALEKELR